MIYVIFGSCKDITIGPTALMSLMTYQYVQGRSVDFAILLAFLTGCMQLLMAALRLGKILRFLGNPVLNFSIFNVFLETGVLVDFISIPVTVGFTSATSVIIVVSQLKGLLGLRISSTGFMDTLKQVLKNLDKTSPWDLAMSITCIVTLLLLRVKITQCLYKKAQY